MLIAKPCKRRVNPKHSENRVDDTFLCKHPLPEYGDCDGAADNRWQVVSRSVKGRRLCRSQQQQSHKQGKDQTQRNRGQRKVEGHLERLYEPGIVGEHFNEIF